MKIHGKNWHLVQDSFEMESMGKYESLFFLGNGFLGLRGNLEEDDLTYERGTYINGFYETEPFIYGETAYGYPPENQTLLNLPDGKRFSIRMDGELLTLASVTGHRRILDMERGVLVRKFRWKVSSGASADVSITRLVSLSRRSVAVQVLEFSFSAVPGQLEIVSYLSKTPAAGSGPPGSDPRKGSDPVDGGLERKKIRHSEGDVIADYMTVNSALSLSAGMSHTYSGAGNCFLQHEEDELGSAVRYRFSGISEKLLFVKFLSYRRGDSTEAENCGSLCAEDLAFCRNKGWRYFADTQRDVLDSFWERSDVRIDGDPEVQIAMRFSLFHLLQSAGRDGKTSVAAKGLSGRGYDGHYFWDSEIYIIPFFIYTDPSVARSLLSYRYSILDYARKRAEELSHRGALYPWRTINGRESSAYFPAGTAQYHINADIAYTLDKYLEITGDTDFLKECGFEILAETARFWSDFGNYIPSRDGAFCIHEVTGPDEYSALVNNNYYTNLMAKNNLDASVKWYGWLKRNDPVFLRDAGSRLGLSEHEIEEWEKASVKMYLPYNRDLDLIPQDDSFLDRPVWDFDSTPKDKYPLLLHFHPLTIYRFQVLKQADLVMALFLKNDFFSMEEKRRNFDYYEGLTTGDSSLSAAIQGIVASELGYEKKGYEYFLKTLFMDYHDINGNVQDGIHTAAMGGAWMMAVYGFAGMREVNGRLHFNPELPGSLERLSFKLSYRGSLFSVAVEKESASFRLISGPPVEITVNGKSFTLSENKDTGIRK